MLSNSDAPFINKIHPEIERRVEMETKSRKSLLILKDLKRGKESMRVIGLQTIKLDTFMKKRFWIHLVDTFRRDSIKHGNYLVNWDKVFQIVPDFEIILNKLNYLLERRKI